MSDPDCVLSIRALGDNAGGLTGFTRRAIAALAHLRECWCIADDINQQGIEAAIAALLASRSLGPAGSTRPLALEALGHTLDEGMAAELRGAVTGILIQPFGAGAAGGAIDHAERERLLRIERITGAALSRIEKQSTDASAVATAGEALAECWPAP